MLLKEQGKDTKAYKGNTIKGRTRNKGRKEESERNNNKKAFQEAEDAFSEFNGESTTEEFGGDSFSVEDYLENLFPDFSYLEPEGSFVVGEDSCLPTPPPIHVILDDL